MKFGEQTDYKPQNSWLNFGHDPEHIPDTSVHTRVS